MNDECSGVADPFRWLQNNMERHQQKLVDNASDVPADSQLSVFVPRKIRDSILFVGRYGNDKFCVLFDSTRDRNPLGCTPALTFFPSHSAERTQTYPVSVFPATRFVYGMEAESESSRVVVCHLNYPYTGETLIKLDIYSIDIDCKETLVRVISTETECAGSCMLGTFASPKLGEYVVVWGDLYKGSFFDTFKVTLKDELEIQTSTIRTEVKTCALPFFDLDEVGLGPSWSMYNVSVLAVGGAHPDCIDVLMHKVNLSPDARLKEVFHRVVRLPVPLENIPYTHRANKNTLYASIVSMVHRDDGSSRALVRAMLQETGESSSAVVATTGDPAPAPPSPPPRRKYKHLYAFLLLDLQANAVLDMCIGGLYSVCTIDFACERIVRLVPVVVEEEGP